MTLQKPGRPDIGKTALTSKNNTLVLSLSLERKLPTLPLSKILNHTVKRGYNDHSFNEITDVTSTVKLHHFDPKHLLYYINVYGYDQHISWSHRVCYNRIL
jgi:hypothetical protein